MSDNEFDDIMKAMPSNISKLDSVYMCFKDEHDKWCDSIKNAYAENNDKGMGEHGLVRLPVDGDGLPIHIGDKIDVYQTKNVEVVGIGDQVVFTHYYMGDYHKHFAADCRHHHAPTVEDVLREFAEKITDSQIPSVHPTYEEAITEYAAKLRLADDAE